jgi:hypothetical protein
VRVHLIYLKLILLKNKKQITVHVNSASEINSLHLFFERKKLFTLMNSATMKHGSTVQ